MPTFLGVLGPRVFGARPCAHELLHLGKQCALLLAHLHVVAAAQRWSCTENWNRLSLALPAKTPRGSTGG